MKTLCCKDVSEPFKHWSKWLRWVFGAAFFFFFLKEWWDCVPRPWEETYATACINCNVISLRRSAFLSPRGPVGKTRSGWIWEWRREWARGELIWYFPKKKQKKKQPPPLTLNQSPLSMSDRDTTSGNTVGTLSFQVCGWSSGFLNIFP